MRFARGMKLISRLYPKKKQEEFSRMAGMALLENKDAAKSSSG